MIGAKWVLIIWFGWLIVSASITTNCNPRANSKILSTSFCTSTKNIVRWCQNIRFTVYANLQRFFFKPSFCSLSALSACLASERSAGIRVMLTLPSKWRRMKSKTAFCIISVTEIIIKIQTKNDWNIDLVTSISIFNVNPRNFHPRKTHFWAGFLATTFFRVESRP